MDKLSVGAKIKRRFCRSRDRILTSIYTVTAVGKTSCIIYDGYINLEILLRFRDLNKWEFINE